jgi:hypothetical protein
MVYDREMWTKAQANWRNLFRLELPAAPLLPQPVPPKLP